MNTQHQNGDDDTRDQISLFDIAPDWRDTWQGMPEFLQKDREPAQRITVNFASLDDARRFGEVIGQRVTAQTDTLWFPKPEIVAPKHFVYTDESKISDLHTD